MMANLAPCLWIFWFCDICHLDDKIDQASKCVKVVRVAAARRKHDVTINNQCARCDEYIFKSNLEYFLMFKYLVSGWSGSPLESIKKRSKNMSLSLTRRTAKMLDWSTFCSSFSLKLFTENTKWSTEIRTCSSKGEK